MEHWQEAQDPKNWEPELIKWIVIRVSLFARHLYKNTSGSTLHSATAWMLLYSDSALLTGFSYERATLIYFADSIYFVDLAWLCACALSPYPEVGGHYVWQPERLLKKGWRGRPSTGDPGSCLYHCHVL